MGSKVLLVGNEEKGKGKGKGIFIDVWVEPAGCFLPPFCVADVDEADTGIADTSCDADDDAEDDDADAAVVDMMVWEEREEVWEATDDALPRWHLPLPPSIPSSSIGVVVSCSFSSVDIITPWE